MRIAIAGRRRFVLACAALGGPSLLAAAGPARAFRREPLAAADQAAYAAEGCPSPEGLHAALRDELAAALGDGVRSPLAEAQLRQRIEALARCPWCGCPVLGAADHGEGEADPPGPPAAPPHG
ncbi:hypothetical protein GCM10010964_44070 [Caldovatus sediminis]|uniref:Uncharacterized protein n=1 Tax=Caldovatus sediminis TaxID=2041189 RepID=A0A8J2ZFX0_9PROT|nr:hypothetical protein [Caldovatus sediminis]GGG52112.1 hypothetical protein GCM10010964_44070 [Caldovatus sediminis]